mmetsp:Transcript_2357/g.6602  ORF Transcript_2357/g.6602 Transcript_2357/m.6602 type:complete len:229 (+) Transcript_2357:370-1056(+)
MSSHALPRGTACSTTLRSKGPQLIMHASNGWGCRCPRVASGCANVLVLHGLLVPRVAVPPLRAGAATADARDARRDAAEEDGRLAKEHVDLIGLDVEHAIADAASLFDELHGRRVVAHLGAIYSENDVPRTDARLEGAIVSNDLDNEHTSALGRVGKGEACRPAHLDIVTDTSLGVDGRVLALDVLHGLLRDRGAADGGKFNVETQVPHRCTACRARCIAPRPLFVAV